MASSKETAKSAVVLVKNESDEASKTSSSPGTTKSAKVERGDAKAKSENPVGDKRIEKKSCKPGADGSEAMEFTPPVVSKAKIVAKPIIQQSSINYTPTNATVPRRGPPEPIPVKLDERPLVLATHLVPSLPIALFEILAEVIEATTGQAVVLVHEARAHRPVAKDLVDIAVLPASQDWEEGTLLPVGFVFEHSSNIDKDPAVYVDIVVARDSARNVEEIIDLRGHRCALPDRHKALGAAALLFDYLNARGENPSFFGDTLDSGSQLATLRMVAGKQADLGVLESPVINCHRSTLPGFDSTHVLASLGPLPPYRLMLNNKFTASFRDKIKNGLLNIDELWTERLRAFGVTGFAEYREERYDRKDVRSFVTSVPYY